MPTFMPASLTASVYSLTISRFAGVFFSTFRSEYLVSNSATPSWCLDVMTTYWAPARLNKSAQALASNFEAVKPSHCFM